MEFRFGICASSEKIGGARKKKYIYNRYQVDCTPENIKGFSISLKHEDKKTKVFLTTRGDVPNTIEIKPYTEHPLETGDIERVRYTEFKRVANYLLNGIVNITTSVVWNEIKGCFGDEGTNVD